MEEFSPWKRFYAMLELILSAMLFDYLARFYKIASLLTQNTHKSLKRSQALGVAYPVESLNQINKL
jgi:hypothetical protein